MSESTGDEIRDAVGTVKWFDPRKGFGFIIGPDQQDIFAHYSNIKGDGFRVLKDGATVRYDAQHGDKGWRATRIERTEPASGSDAGGSSTDPTSESAGDSSGEVRVVKRTDHARTPRR